MANIGKELEIDIQLPEVERIEIPESVPVEPAVVPTPDPVPASVPAEEPRIPA